MPTFDKNQTPPKVQIPTSDLDLVRKREKLLLLERKIQLQEGLPFLYGWKWYPWALEFYESANKVNLLCAANQVSKSSTQIRKCINWATDMSLWKQLWPDHRPNQFWYLYPTSKQTRIEFETKWKLFLPTGKFKTEKTLDFGDGLGERLNPYHWKAEYADKELFAIHFVNTGVYVYFKTYAQKTEALQTGTVHALFCFTGQNLVRTTTGLKPIKDIRPGEFVPTKEGQNRRVEKNFSRTARTIRRLLSNGEYVDATPDHRLWASNHWVELQHLTPQDSLETQSLCEKESWVKASALWWVDTFITGTLCPGIGGTGISKIILGLLRDSYTSSLGKSIGVRSLLVLSCIIWMKIRGTIRLATWPVSRRLSTLGCINKRSGPEASLGSLKEESASNAEKNSKLDPLKELQGLFAPRSVGVFLREQWFCAQLAVKNLFVQETVKPSIFALMGALDLGEKEVFCLNVDQDHNFQVCGIIGKNCDEELPVEHYSELIFRISACDGYFHMVFTATLGQEFWRLAMEPEEHERLDGKEELPNAWKKSVSMYECQKYVDGTTSHWSADKIQMVIDRCTSHDEVLRRVYGRFVMATEGKTYGTFDIKKHLKPDHKLPGDWLVYEGVDLGSGGKTGHKAAICFVAVDPKFQKGRVFLGWRGAEEITTAGDVFETHLQLKASRQLAPTLQCYDAGARDFFTIACRAHESFVPADKARDKGEQIINTLFKNDMLYVYATPELQKLATELSTLKRDTPKTKAKDDFCDALRYAVSQIPWDWSMIGRAVPDVEAEKEELSPGDQEVADRRARFSDNAAEEARVEDEFNEWNEAYGSD